MVILNTSITKRKKIDLVGWFKLVGAVVETCPFKSDKKPF